MSKLSHSNRFFLNNYNAFSRNNWCKNEIELCVRSYFLQNDRGEQLDENMTIAYHILTEQTKSVNTFNNLFVEGFFIKRQMIWNTFHLKSCKLHEISDDTFLITILWNDTNRYLINTEFVSRTQIQKLYSICTTSVCEIEKWNFYEIRSHLWMHDIGHFEIIYFENVCNLVQNMIKLSKELCEIKSENISRYNNITLSLTYRVDTKHYWYARIFYFKTNLTSRLSRIVVYRNSCKVFQIIAIIFCIHQQSLGTRRFVSSN